MDEPCPRCGGTAFTEKDCGPDSYDDDITYTSYVCDGCGLWYDGWQSKWLVDVETWQEAEGAEEYVRPSVTETIERLWPQLEAGVKYLNRPMTDADRRVEVEPYMEEKR